MSRSFRSVASSSKMAARRWLALSILAACVAPIGCSSEKPSSEVSASSSGYRPVDAPKGTAPKGNAGKDTAATGADSSAPNATTLADSGASKASSTSNTPGSLGGKSGGAPASNATNAPGTAAPEKTNNPPSVPALPTFNPGQVDPSIAAKSYMRLEMTQSQDPTEILRFIGAIDRSLQELQHDACAVDVYGNLADHKATAKRNLVGKYQSSSKEQ